MGNAKQKRALFSNFKVRKHHRFKVKNKQFLLKREKLKFFYYEIFILFTFNFISYFV